MRTTLDIDDDVLRAAKERASREGSTGGKVISELARGALTAAPRAGVREPRAVYGFRPLAPRGGVVTNEPIDRLHDASPLHEFWPDDVSLLDPRVADATRIHGPRQLTDLYLLALAVSHSACFVTFDAAIAREAIVGATATNLVRL